MAEKPSESGSKSSSKSASPHDPTKVYDSIIIANLDDPQVFSVISHDTVFDDGRNLADIFSFNPTVYMDKIKRSARKYASMDGREIYFSIFARVEQGTTFSFMTKYINDLNKEIKSATGSKRHAKFEQLILRYREKVSKDFLYTPREHEGQPFVGAPIADGAHATRSSKTIDSTTECSDTNQPSTSEAIEPASAHLLKVAAGKARKELSQKGRPNLFDSDMDEDDFVSSEKQPRGGRKRTASPDKSSAASKTPAKKQTATKAATKATPSKNTQAKSAATPARKSSRTPKKLNFPPLNIVTKKSIPPPPTTEPPSKRQRKRAPSPKSVSSTGTPTPNPSATQTQHVSESEDNEGEESEVPPPVDSTFAFAAPSSSNARLMTTFLSPQAVQTENVEDPNITFGGAAGADPAAEDEGGNNEEPTEEPTATEAIEAGRAMVSAKIGGGSFADFKKYLDERDKMMKEFIETETKKIARRQYKIIDAIKELKGEQAKFKASVADVLSSNSKIYDKLKLVGDQTAEKKGAIASSLLGFFPLDVTGVFGDIMLACSYIQKQLAPLIARQIAIVKTNDVNKTIGNGIMNFLFSSYSLGHFIIGDVAASLRSLCELNRPVPVGVINVIIPSVVEILMKKVTMKGKTTNENVKIIRGGFSDLFGNNRSSFIQHIYDTTKNMDELFKATYMADKVFFEANKHVQPSGTKFLTEQAHREAMLGRERVDTWYNMELNGLVKKERKKKFVSPQEAVMNLRYNVGADQMTAEETIAFIIDTARDNGDKYDNFIFNKDCRVKNVQAIYAKVLATKKAEYAEAAVMAPRVTQQVAVVPARKEPTRDVFGEDSPPMASTSGRKRDSLKAIIAKHKEAKHFPERKATTSSSNSNVANDSDSDEEVFEEPQGKKKKKVTKKGKKDKAKKDDDETTTEEDIVTSGDETSEDGLDNVYLEEQARGESDGEKEAEAGKAQSEAGEAQSEAGEAQSEAGEAQSEAGEAQSEAGEAQSEAGEAQSEAGEVLEEPIEGQEQQVVEEQTEEVEGGKDANDNITPTSLSADNQVETPPADN